MIEQCMSDLIAKIKTIPDFGTAPSRVGAAAGAKNIDPTMSKVTIPAAWVVFVGDENLNGNDDGDCGPTLRLNFIVKIIIDYTTEVDLTTVQLPVLVNTINAVSGKQGPAGGKKWRYGGQTLDEMTGNRIVFDQRYSIVVVV